MNKYYNILNIGEVFNYDIYTSIFSYLKFYLSSRLMYVVFSTVLIIYIYHQGTQGILLVNDDVICFGIVGIIVPKKEKSYIFSFIFKFNIFILFLFLLTINIKMIPFMYVGIISFFINVCIIPLIFYLYLYFNYSIKNNIKKIKSVLISTSTSSTSSFVLMYPLPFDPVSSSTSYIMRKGVGYWLNSFNYYKEVNVIRRQGFFGKNANCVYPKLFKDYKHYSLEIEERLGNDVLSKEDIIYCANELENLKNVSHVTIGSHIQRLGMVNYNRIMSIRYKNIPGESISTQPGSGLNYGGVTYWQYLQLKKLYFKKFEDYLELNEKEVAKIISFCKNGKIDFLTLSTENKIRIFLAVNSDVDVVTESKIFYNIAESEIITLRVSNNSSKYFTSDEAADAGLSATSGVDAKDLKCSEDRLSDAQRIQIGLAEETIARSHRSYQESSASELLTNAGEKNYSTGFPFEIPPKQFGVETCSNLYSISRVPGAGDIMDT